MPLYEHVIIARQDLSSAQAAALGDELKALVAENGGTVASEESWGLRTLAFKIRKNRKGHYLMLRLDAPAACLAELERRERLHEDVLRYMSVRVEAHQEGPSIVLTSKNVRDDRRRDRRDRGPRPDRPRDDRPRDDRPRDDRPRDDRPRDDRPRRDDAAPVAEV